MPVPNKKLIAFSVFILTILFYVYTLSPSLAWGDGVKLQSEVISGESFILSEMTEQEYSPDPFIFSKVGVTAWDHPLYIIMGHTLVRALPFINSLWLVNLISAIFGAASIALIFWLCHQYTNSWFASCYAALSLVVSHTFWWHSSTPEVYTLLAFLLLFSIYFFDQFEKSGEPRSLIFSAFLFGTSASVHILAFLAVPALGLYFLLSKKYQHLRIGDWQKLTLPLLGFLAGFSLYIIQFFRMSRNLPPREITGAMIGSTFLNGLGALSPVVLGESLLNYLLYLLLQFGPVGIALGVVGIRKAFDHSHLSLRKTISFFIVYTLFGIFYRVSDQFAFFMMSHVFFAVLMGIGATHLLSTLQIKTRLILTCVLILTIVLTPPFYRALPRIANANGLDDSFLRIPQIGTGVRNGLAYYIDPNKRGDYRAYDFGNQTIAELAPNSIVIAEWYTDTDEYFVLRYFNKVAGVRPDVTIIGWPTQDPFSFDSQVALNVIKDSFPDRPVYLASLSDKFYAASTLIEMFCIVPENNLYRLYQKGENDLQCLGADSVTE